MKEVSIINYKCDICHKIYSNKEDAITCEEQHYKYENMPIKCICYDEDGYPELRVFIYPNALYNKDRNMIKLHSNSLLEGNKFVSMSDYALYFDEVQYIDDTLIKIYTRNMSESYEKECIKTIIDSKINRLNEKINKLKDEKFLTNIYRIEFK